MDKIETYRYLKLPIPETMNDPGYIIPCQFLPSDIPDLLKKEIEEIRRQTGKNEPYTIEEFQLLFREGSVLEAPKISEIEDTPEMQGISKEDIFYPIQRAFFYKKACEKYNHLRKHEKLLLKKYKKGSASPSFLDYLEYLTSKHKESLGSFFSPWRLPILEEHRERHTYISGKSGSRKSTLLKVLIYNYLRKPSAGVIVFDPHGDLAEAVAKMSGKIDPERLVYFDPTLDPEYTPVINPLELDDKSPQNVNLATNELIAAFRSVLENSKPPTQFTSQMEAVLKPCISTLMIRPGSTLEDLMDFMDDERNPPLVAYAKKVLKNPKQLDFMNHDFKKETYDSTKQSIRTKLMILFNSDSFRLCLCGKSTIDIKKEMDARKIVIFKLSTGKLSEETASAIGRFLISRYQSIAQQREDIPEDDREPNHMFIDECELFVSDKVEKILKESRKYKLYLTLAQQVFGAKMSEDLRNAILSNTVVKFTGANGNKTLKIMKEETGADIEELQSLNAGEFHLKTEGTKSIKISTPGFLRDKKYTLTSKEWGAIKAMQLSRYYSRVGGTKNIKIQNREVPIIDLD